MSTRKTWVTLSNETLDAGPQIMQLVFFFNWKSHFEEKDVCVTVHGLAQKSCGSSLHHHTQQCNRTGSLFSTWFEGPSYFSTLPFVLLAMKEKQAQALSQTHTHTHTAIETVEQHVRSKHGTLAASQNHRWLSRTLPQPVTGDCSISSLWRTGQLSERETHSLGNSSPLISTLRGAGCAISG